MFGEIMFTTRFEINVIHPKSNPIEAVDFASRYACPAIVTVPEMVAPFIAARSIRRALFKVIVAVDLPNGNNFAMQKLRDLGPDALAADGFDIVASPKRNAKEALNEVKLLTDFIRTMNPLADIRWSLGALDRSEVDYIEHIKSVLKVPCNFLRTDHRTYYPNIKVDDHKRIVESIRKFIGVPIKVSGNVDITTYRAFEHDKSIRFDVTLDQAQSLIKAPHENNNEQKTQEKLSEQKTSQQSIDGEKVVGTLGQDVE
jgi:hypothetical protein